MNLEEARDRYAMPWHETADYDYVKECADFDRLIAKVQAETLREFSWAIPGDVHDPRHIADLARGVADHIEWGAGL